MLQVVIFKFLTLLLLWGEYCRILHNPFRKKQLNYFNVVYICVLKSFSLCFFFSSQPQQQSVSSAPGQALTISEHPSDFKNMKRYLLFLKLGREYTQTYPGRMPFIKSHLLLSSFKFCFISLSILFFLTKGKNTWF